MNYYEKLIQEKNNARDYDDINKVYKEAKRIVDDLRRKYREISGRERDDGNFLYSIIEEKGMPTESGDRQKAKHAAGLLESVRRMSTTPRDWGNSKGETNMGYYADLMKEKKEKTNSLSEKAKQIISKAVAEARFDYRTAIDFAIADLKAEKEWAWTSQSEVSQMVQRLIKNRMDFGFNSENSKKEKENAYAKLVKKLSDFDIYEDAEGYFMRVKDGKLLKGGYLSIRDAETDGHRAKSASKDNEKENSLIGRFDDLRPKDEKTVKEYIRQVKNFIRQCEAKSERSDYAKDYRDLNKRAAESYKKDVEKAERWLSEHRNSDEEKGYYAKLAEEKASRKN